MACDTRTGATKTNGWERRDVVRLENASKTIKQISSSGMWIDCSKRIGVFSRVSSSAAERARRSRATRSPAWLRAR